MSVCKENENGKVFAGAGTYALGGLGRLVPQGGIYYHPAGNPVASSDYQTINFGTPTGTLHLTRYDSEQGTAAGTFEFNGLLVNNSASLPNLPNHTSVTNGEFDITF